MVYLETERLLLRKVSWEDYPYFREYIMDKEMDRLMLRWPSETEEEVQKMFEWFLYKEKYAYAILQKESGDTIGNLTVYETPPSVVTEHPQTKGKEGRALSFAIGRKWQRKGYMSEVLKALIAKLFNEEKVDYINSGFLSINEPSKYLHEKLGFGYLLQETFELDGVLYTGVETILRNHTESVIQA